jgi:thioredoxin 1
MSEITLTVTDENFEDVTREGYVLVDFWAPWCGPCRLVAPVVEQLAQEYRGRVQVGKMNVDENPQTSMKYRVMSIPTVILFKDGQPVETMVGAAPKNAYDARLAKHVTQAVS